MRPNAACLLLCACGWLLLLLAGTALGCDTNWQTPVCIDGCNDLAFVSTSPGLISHTGAITDIVHQDHTYNAPPGYCGEYVTWDFTFEELQVDNYEYGNCDALYGGTNFPLVEVSAGTHTVTYRVCGNDYEVCTDGSDSQGPIETCATCQYSVSVAGPGPSDPPAFLGEGIVATGLQQIVLNATLPSGNNWGGVGPTYLADQGLCGSEGVAPGYWCSFDGSYLVLWLQSDDGESASASLYLEWYYSDYDSDSHTLQAVVDDVCPGVASATICIENSCSDGYDVCSAAIATSIPGVPEAPTFVSVGFDYLGNMQLYLAVNTSQFLPANWQLNLTAVPAYDPFLNYTLERYVPGEGYQEVPYDRYEFPEVRMTGYYLSPDGDGVLYSVSVWDWYWTLVENALPFDALYNWTLALSIATQWCSGQQVQAVEAASFPIPLPPVYIRCVTSRMLAPSAASCGLSYYGQPPSFDSQPGSDWLTISVGAEVDVTELFPLVNVTATLTSATTGAVLVLNVSADEAIGDAGCWEEGLEWCFHFTVPAPLLDWYSIVVSYTAGNYSSLPSQAYVTPPPPVGPLLQSVWTDDQQQLLFLVDAASAAVPEQYLGSPEGAFPVWQLQCGLLRDDVGQMEYCGQLLSTNSTQFGNGSDVLVLCPDWFLSVLAPYVVGQQPQLSCSLLLGPCDNAGECYGLIAGINTLSTLYGLYPPPAPLCMQPPMPTDWSLPPDNSSLQVNFQLPTSAFYQYSTYSYTAVAVSSQGLVLTQSFLSSDLPYGQQFVVMTNLTLDETYDVSLVFTDSNGAQSGNASLANVTLPFACIGGCYGLKGFCFCPSCPGSPVNASYCGLADGYISLLSAPLPLPNNQIAPAASPLTLGSSLSTVSLSAPFTLAMRLRLSTLQWSESGTGVMPLFSASWGEVDDQPGGAFTVLYEVWYGAGSVSVTFPSGPSYQAALTLSSDWTVLGVSYQLISSQLSNLCFYGDDALIACFPVSGASPFIETEPGSGGPASLLQVGGAANGGAPPSLDLDSIHILSPDRSWAEVWDSLYEPEHAPQYLPPAALVFGTSFALGLANLSLASSFLLDGALVATAGELCPFPVLPDQWSGAEDDGPELDNAALLPVSLQTTPSIDLQVASLSPFLLPGFTLLSNRMWYATAASEIATPDFTSVLFPAAAWNSSSEAESALLQLCYASCMQITAVDAAATVCHSFVIGMDGQGEQGVCWLRSAWRPEHELPIIPYPAPAGEFPSNVMDTLAGQAAFYHMLLFDTQDVVPLYISFGYAGLTSPQPEQPQLVPVSWTGLPAVADRFGCAYLCGFTSSVYCVAYTWTRYGECEFFAGPWATPTLPYDPVSLHVSRTVAYVNSWAAPKPCSNCVQATILDCPACMTSELYSTGLLFSYNELGRSSTPALLNEEQQYPPPPSQCAILPSALNAAPLSPVTVQQCGALCRSYESWQVSGQPYSCTGFLLSMPDSYCYLLVQDWDGYESCAQAQQWYAQQEDSRSRALASSNCNLTSSGANATRCSLLSSLYYELPPVFSDVQYGYEGDLWTDLIVMWPVQFFQFDSVASSGETSPWSLALPQSLQYDQGTPLSYNLSAALLDRQPLYLSVQQCQAVCARSQACLIAVTDTDALGRPTCVLLANGELSVDPSLYAPLGLVGVPWTAENKLCGYGQWADQATGTCASCPAGTYYQFFPDLYNVTDPLFGPVSASATGTLPCLPCDCSNCTSCDPFTGVCVWLGEVCYIEQDQQCFAAGDSDPGLPSLWANCSTCQPAIDQSVWTVTTAPCDDSNACTYDDSCTNGSCIGVDYSSNCTAMGDCAVCDGLGGCYAMDHTCLTSGSQQTCGCLLSDPFGNPECIAWNSSKPSSFGCAVSGELIDGTSLRSCAWDDSTQSAMWSPSLAASCSDGDPCHYNGLCSGLQCNVTLGPTCNGSEWACAINPQCDGNGSCTTNGTWTVSDQFVCQAADWWTCSSHVECNGTNDCPIGQPDIPLLDSGSIVLSLAFPDFRAIQLPSDDVVLQYPFSRAVYVNASNISVPCGGLSYQAALYAITGSNGDGCPLLSSQPPVYWPGGDPQSAQPDSLPANSSSIGFWFNLSKSPLRLQDSYQVLLAAYTYDQTEQPSRCLPAPFQLGDAVPAAESFRLTDSNGCCWAGSELISISSLVCANASIALVSVRYSNDSQHCSWWDQDNQVVTNCSASLVLQPTPLLMSTLALPASVSMPAVQDNSSLVATLICMADNTDIATLDSQQVLVDASPPVVQIVPITATMLVGNAAGRLQMAQTDSSTLQFNYTVEDLQSGVNSLSWCASNTIAACSDWVAMSPFTLEPSASTYLMQHSGSQSYLIPSSPSPQDTSFVISIRATNRANLTSIVASLPVFIAPTVSQTITGPVLDGTALMGDRDAQYGLDFSDAELSSLQLAYSPIAEARGNDSLACHWLTSNSTTSPQWVDQAGIAYYELQFVLESGSNFSTLLPVPSEPEPGTDGIVSAVFNLSDSAFAEHSVEQGDTYICRVRAVSAAGIASPFVPSDGLRFVSLPPTSGSVYDLMPFAPATTPPLLDTDGYYNLTTIAVGWSGLVDVGSAPLVYYNWSVGSSPGLADILSVSLSPDSINSQASWPDALKPMLAQQPRVYSTIQAVNAAGLYSAASSNGTSFTLGPIPQLSQVNDGDDGYYDSVVSLPSMYGVQERQCLQIAPLTPSYEGYEEPEFLQVWVQLQLCNDSSAELQLLEQGVGCGNSSAVLISAASVDEYGVVTLGVNISSLQSELQAAMLEALWDLDPSQEPDVRVLYQDSSLSTELPLYVVGQSNASALYCFDFPASYGDLQPLALLVQVNSSSLNTSYLLTQDALVIDPLLSLWTAQDGQLGSPIPAVAYTNTAPAVIPIPIPAMFDSWVVEVDPTCAVSSFGGSWDLDYTSDTSTLSASWDDLPNVQYYRLSFGQACGASVALCDALVETSSPYASVPISSCALPVGSTIFATVLAMSVFRGPSSYNETHYTVGCSDGVFVVPNAPTLPAPAADDLSTLISGYGNFGVQISYVQYLYELSASWTPAVSDYQYRYLNASSANVSFEASLLVSSAWCLGSAPAVCNGIPWQPNALNFGLVPDMPQAESYPWGWLAATDWRYYEPAMTPLLLNTSLTLQSVYLPNGLYYVSVRTTDRAGSSVIAQSTPFILDGSSPTAGVLSVGATSAYSLVSQPQTHRLSVTWGNFSATSGIAMFSWAIGSSPYGDDLMSWTAVGPVLFASASGLSLTPGSFVFVSVQAQSYAGLTRLVAAKVNIDPTPPAPGQVQISGVVNGLASPLFEQFQFTNVTYMPCVDYASTGLQTLLQVTLVDWFDEYGWVASFSLAVGSSPSGQQLQPFTPLPPGNDTYFECGWNGYTTSNCSLLTFTLPLRSGSLYYLTAMATDAAGNSATAVAVPFLADSTPPTAGSVIVQGGATAAPPSLLFVNVTDAQDDESGVDSIMVSVAYQAPGSQAGWSSYQAGRWWGPANEPQESITMDVDVSWLLVGSVVQLTVSVFNGAGLVTNFTSQQLVLDDAAPYPTSSIACESCASFTDGQYWQSAAVLFNGSEPLLSQPLNLSFSWQGFQDIADISSYSYQLTSQWWTGDWQPMTVLTAAALQSTPQLLFSSPSLNGSTFASQAPSSDPSYVRVDLSLQPASSALSAAMNGYDNSLTLWFELIAEDAAGFSTTRTIQLSLSWLPPQAGTVWPLTAFPAYFIRPGSLQGLELELNWYGFWSADMAAIAGYEISAGTGPGLDNVVSWSPIGLASSALLRLDSVLDVSGQAAMIGVTVSSNVSLVSLPAFQWDFSSGLEQLQFSVRAVSVSGLYSAVVSCPTPLVVVTASSQPGTVLLSYDAALSQATVTASGWTPAAANVTLQWYEAALLLVTGSATALQHCIAAAAAANLGNASVDPYSRFGSLFTSAGCNAQLLDDTSFGTYNSLPELWSTQVYVDAAYYPGLLFAWMAWTDSLMQTSAISQPVWLDDTPPLPSSIVPLSATQQQEDEYGAMVWYQAVPSGLGGAVGGTVVSVAASWSPFQQPYSGLAGCSVDILLYDSSGLDVSSPSLQGIAQSAFNTSVSASLLLYPVLDANTSTVLLSVTSYAVQVACTGNNNLTASAISPTVQLDALLPQPGAVVNLGFSVLPGADPAEDEYYEYYPDYSYYTPSLASLTQRLAVAEGAGDCYGPVWRWLELGEEYVQLMEPTSFAASPAVVTASWSGFVFPGSSLVQYELSIGSSAGGTQLLDWQSLGPDVSAVAVLLPLGSGVALLQSACASEQSSSLASANVTQWFVSVRATVASGLQCVATSAGVTVDDGPVLPTASLVLAQGAAWQTQTRQTSVSWSAPSSASPLLVLQLQLFALCNPILVPSCAGGLMDDSVPLSVSVSSAVDAVLVPWMTVSGAGTLNLTLPSLFTNDHLNDGARLMAVLQAVNAAGTMLLQPSNAVTLAFLPPNSDSVRVVPTSATAFNGSLYQALPYNLTDANATLTIAVSWSGFSDVALPITGYSWFIGSQAGESDLLPAQTAGGTHMASCELSGSTVADFIAAQQLLAGAAVTSSQWMPVYYITVQAVDEAGLAAVQSSLPVYLDSRTGPLSAPVLLQPVPAVGGPSLSWPAVYPTFQSSSELVSATWSAFTALHAPVSGYSASIGTGADGEQIFAYAGVGLQLQAAINLSSPAMVKVPLALNPAEVYYVSVRATTVLGEEAFSTAALLVDQSPPPTAGAQLIDGTASSCAEEVEFQSSALSRVCWYSAALFDPESFTVQLSVGLSSAPNSQLADVLPLQAVQDDWIYSLPLTAAQLLPAGSGVVNPATGIDWAGVMAVNASLVSWVLLPRPVGVVSYAVLQAVNSVGQVSYAWSDGSLYDATAPLLLSPYSVFDQQPPSAFAFNPSTALTDVDCVQAAVSDGSSSPQASMAAVWLEMSDPESGVSDYSYAVSTASTTTGQSSGYSFVLPFTSVGLNLSATSQPFAVQLGVVYYFLVKASNPSGLSTVAASDGVVFTAATAANAATSCLAVLSVAQLSDLTDVSGAPAVLPLG